MFPSTTSGLVMMNRGANLVENHQEINMDTTNSHSSFNLQQPSHLPLSFSPFGIQNNLTNETTTCTVRGGGDHTNISHLRPPFSSSLPQEHGDHDHLGESSAQRSHIDLWASNDKLGSASASVVGVERMNHSKSRTNPNNNSLLSVGGMRMKKVKARRKVREPRFCFKTMSEVDVLDDGYKWRKYGQKVVKNTQHPRSYYRCTQENCRVKKRIERLAEDPRMVITTYEGRHVHSPSHDDEESQPSSSSKVTLFW
ncbi:putative WRKY transcription factor 57 [Canna indica]|uniref:WRKY transcription factor 57 n=1 Tax=Canna indica TaxID=4628 RepID=A0AAQ3QG96_9LILI|nr:putative WRKY transcription factor 57 [Canna indica]